MRRVDRVRLEKRRRQLGVVGLAFTLGALTASSLMWRLDQTAGLSITDTIGSPEPGLEPRATAGTTAVPRATGISSSDSDDEDDELVRLLRTRRLEVPVQGVDRNQLHDSFDDRRGIRRHEAIDIMAPRGTLVLSVEDGRVAKLFESVAGGLTVYIFDPAERSLATSGAPATRRTTRRICTSQFFNSDPSAGGGRASRSIPTRFFASTPTRTRQTTYGKYRSITVARSPP
jgi:hypothetical protein